MLHSIIVSNQYFHSKNTNLERQTSCKRNINRKLYLTLLYKTLLHKTLLKKTYLYNNSLYEVSLYKISLYKASFYQTSLSLDLLLIMDTSLAPSPMASVTAFLYFLTSSTTKAFWRGVTRQHITAGNKIKQKTLFTQRKHKQTKKHYCTRILHLKSK